MSSEEKIKKIYEKLNKSESGFISNAGRVKTNGMPSLIIGIGGTGGEAVLRLKRLLRDKIELENEKNADKPENVEYLVIDTDVAASNLSDEDVRLNSHNNEFLLVRNADLVHIIKELQREDSKYKEKYNWLDEIPKSRIVNGAGGIRQAGRLILTLNADRIISSIKNKIDIISRGHELALEEINVYIFFGVGGGTGSGMFIDVAYIVRELIEKENGNPNITGMVFLPDVSLAKPGLDPITKNNICHNGYAALSELDYYMDLEQRKKNFEFNYGCLKIKSNMDIFENCLLFGAADMNRKEKYPADKTAINIASEAVWAIIANDSSGGISNDYNSFFSNVVPYLAMQKAKINSETDHSYKYTLCGETSYILPYNEVYEYLIYEFFNYLDKHQNKEKFDKEDLIEKLCLTKSSISAHYYKQIINDIPSYLHNIFNIKNKIEGSYKTVDNELEKIYKEIENLTNKELEICLNKYGPSVVKSDFDKTKDHLKLPNNKHARRITNRIRNSTKKAHEILDKGTEILSDINAVYNNLSEISKQYESNKDKEEKVSADRSKDVVDRIITPKDLIEYIKEKRLISDSNYEETKTEFFRDLRENWKIWCGESDQNTIEHMVSFFEKQFNKTIEKAIRKYINNEMEIKENIFNQIDKNGNVQFPFDPTYLLTNPKKITNTIVKVPKMFSEALDLENIDKKFGMAYATSGIKNRIGKITFQVNVSLEEYAEMKMLAEKFEEYQNHTGAFINGLNNQHTYFS